MELSKNGVRTVMVILGIFFVLWQLDGIASRIQSSSTTRFVGSFPSNMESIVALVKQTHSTLMIVGDFCAYGNFSQPKLFEEYKSALLALPNKAHSVQVEMYLYEPTTANTAAADQFPDWETIKNSDTFKSYFEYYKNDSHRPIPRSRDEFIQLIQSQQERCVQELQAKDIVVKRTINRQVPIFIWLRDNQEAIFSVYNLGPNGSREASLLTNDANLILTLREIAYRVKSGQ